MKNVNVGIANLVVSEALKSAYLSSNSINESQKLTRDLFDVIKSSPILQLEFKVYSNIENKHIDNDIIASRYIDNNIKLFEVYTLKEIQREHDKLIPYITEEIVNKRTELYNAIDTLIKESLNDYDKIDVDKIHESFTLVLNHVKEPKVINEVKDEVINEEVIKIAVDRFNKKYGSLNEDDKGLFSTLVNSTSEEKEVIFESYKSEVLSLLESKNNDETKESIQKAINKIKEMVSSSGVVEDNIIKLHELKHQIL